MATFDPFTEQILGLREQQALAQKLRDQGLEAPQGQTVSGWYVAPNKTQYLAQALKSYLGGQDVQAAQQGIKDLVAQRQKETQDYLAAAPKATTSLLENRAALPAAQQNQMGPSPYSREVTTQPTAQDWLAYASKAPGMDAMTAANLGLKSAELEANRQARLDEARLKVEAEAQREKQRAEDRQDLARLTASLRPSPQEKPLTEFQGKSVMFGTRAAQSHNILNSLEDQANPLAVAASEKGGILANWAISPENQRVAQAQRDFINAVLRQESGASISSGEFDSARKQYFPQPGDSDEVKAQKRANRELVIKGFARQAGPSGAADVEQIYSAGTSSMPKINPVVTPSGLPSQNDIAAEMARRAAAATNVGR